MKGNNKIMLVIFDENGEIVLDIDDGIDPSEITPTDAISWESLVESIYAADEELID